MENFEYETGTKVFFGKAQISKFPKTVKKYDDFEKKTIERFEQSMQVNLYAPFLLTQILAPKMAENKYGKIVNIATIDVMTTYNA